MVFLYKNKKPNVNDIVIARITEINKFNIVANLMDYDNLTGYISYSELSRKKKYKLNKIVNVGKEVIVQVIGFDEIKNFAELSFRALIASDIENFTKTHRKYLNLYNLWRYIFMKLNPHLEMKIENINHLELENFMENTFWKIELNLQDNLDNLDNLENSDNSQENSQENNNNEQDNLDKLYNILLDPKKNESLLNYIDSWDVKTIKNILDNYSQIKFVPVKQTKNKEFTISTFECDGLDNIKNVLNYKLYEKWEEIVDKYEISILYLTGSKYSLIVKEINHLEEDINKVCEYLLDEIKTKCEKNNIIFNM